MSEVMIDLETLGVENDSVILSIGAIEFCTNPFTILQRYHWGLNTKSQEDKGRKIYGSTVTWWLSQSKEAQDSLLLTQKISWQVEHVLAQLEIMCVQPVVKGVWGNGSMFDNALIGSLAKSFGQSNPLPYKKDRCYRTLKNLYPQVELPERNGIHHNALDDAIFQARHLSSIFAEIGVA